MAPNVKKTVRFSADAREAFLKVFRPAVKTSTTPEEVLAKIVQAGAKKPDGTLVNANDRQFVINQMYITGYRLGYARKKYKPRKKHRASKAEPKQPEHKPHETLAKHRQRLIAEILTNPAFDDDTKIVMLSMLCER